MFARIMPLALLAALAAPGCGESDGQVEVYPVSGTVTLNGEPFANAMVRFHPIQPASDDADDPAAAIRVAEADDQGHFALSTYTALDGAPAGDYVVTVEPTLPEAEELDGPPPPSRILPELVKYTEKENSPFKATVTSGDNPPLRFDLE